MPLVVGPNGVTLDLPEAVASGLVDSPSGEYRYVEPEPDPKPRARKTRTSKS